LLARAPPSGDDQDIRLWAVDQRMARIDAELAARPDGFRFLGTSVYMERLEIVSSSRHRKNFERAAEIEDFYICEKQDSDIADGLHGLIIAAVLVFVLDPIVRVFEDEHDNNEDDSSVSLMYTRPARRFPAYAFVFFESERLVEHDRLLR